MKVSARIPLILFGCLAVLSCRAHLGQPTVGAENQPAARKPIHLTTFGAAGLSLSQAQGQSDNPFGLSDKNWQIFKEQAAGGAVVGAGAAIGIGAVFAAGAFSKGKRTGVTLVSTNSPEAKKALANAGSKSPMPAIRKPGKVLGITSRLTHNSSEIYTFKSAAGNDVRLAPGVYTKPEDLNQIKEHVWQNTIDEMKPIGDISNDDGWQRLVREAPAFVVGKYDGKMEIYPARPGPNGKVWRVADNAMPELYRYLIQDPTEIAKLPAGSIALVDELNVDLLEVAQAQLATPWDSARVFLKPGFLKKDNISFQYPAHAPTQPRTVQNLAKITEEGLKDANWQGTRFFNAEDIDPAFAPRYVQVSAAGDPVYFLKYENLDEITTGATNPRYEVEGDALRIDYDLPGGGTHSFNPDTSIHHHRYKELPEDLSKTPYEDSFIRFEGIPEQDLAEFVENNGLRRVEKGLLSGSYTREPLTIL